MSSALKRAAIFPIILGVLLVAAGIFVPTPGGALTTYSGLDGESTSYHEFDDHYSVIDEYVGGDAYNYIIGAALVSGKMGGYIAGKAIFIAVGAICLCAGVSMTIIAGGMERQENMAQKTYSPASDPAALQCGDPNDEEPSGIEDNGQG